MEPASQERDKASRAEDTVFAKPSHSDAHEVEAVQSIQRNQFDPRHPAHRVLDQDRMDQLLMRVQTSIPAWDWITAILENEVIRKTFF